MADPVPVEGSIGKPNERPPTVAVPVELLAGLLGVGAEFSGPVDPLHPEKGMTRYRMSELEMSLYNEKNPERLKDALRRGMDVLDGIPDILYTGDIPLMMNSFVNPEVKPLQSAEYGLYVVINSRLEKAAADLRIRAEAAGAKVGSDTADRMRDEQKRRACGVLRITEDQADDPVYRDIVITEMTKLEESDPRYKDPLIWTYLEKRDRELEKAAETEKVSVAEYKKKHPEVSDPEIVLIEEGIWAEFQARERLHNAWVDRMTTTGSSGKGRGEASSLFVEPGHTDIKAPDWLILFRDAIQAEHEDEAMRAMVDMARGEEVLWTNKENPGDLRVVKKEMWLAMFERRSGRDPSILRDLESKPELRGKSPQEMRDILKRKKDTYELVKKAYEAELKAVSTRMDPAHGRLREAMIQMAGTIPSRWTTLKPEHGAAFAREIPDFDLNERIGGRGEAALAECNKMLGYFEWKNPYPDNFKTSEVFKDWLAYALFRAKGDVRAVYLAWRKFQLWEVISRQGIGSTFDEKKGPNIGDPSMVSDIAAWHYAFRWKREKEFGRVLLPDGSHKDLRGVEGVVGSQTRYAAGPPVTLDHIDRLGKPFLEHAKATVSGEAGKVSLWELWYERGVGLKELPWMATEDPKGWVGEDQEVAPSSFNGWLYQRFNAATVMEWLTKWSVSMPELLKVGDNGKLTIETVVKAFDKTFGEIEWDPYARAKKRLEGEDQYEPFTVANMKNPRLRGRIDPRAIAVVGWITQRHPDGVKDMPGDIPRPRPMADRFGFMPDYNVIGEGGKLAYDTADLLLDVLIAYGFINLEAAKEIATYCKLDLSTGSLVNRPMGMGARPGNIRNRIGKF